MPATFRFGAIEVRPATQQLLVSGVPAAVGARAFDLLLALIERRDRLVPKQELLDVVWRGQVVEEGNLHTQVSSLRKLLGATAITTVPGRGYRFIAALDGVEASSADLAAHPAPPAMEPVPPLPGNLGAHRQPLWGRETELPALLSWVEHHRLVTLVGAAGMGKTALALVAAQALRGRWRDGAWWVDLATVSDPAQLPAVVAQALQIAQPARPQGGSTTDHLQRVLAPMSLLLVLDNCEHLVDAAGAFAEGIVQHAGGVHVLATSQELLKVPGEVVFKLAPLALPAAPSAAEAAEAADRTNDLTADEALQHGAIRLFVERARAANGRFVLAADNLQALVDICRRLDGLPLAIELAAARVRLLGAQGLRDRLGERFRILTSGARTAMHRHQTLAAALDWSHGLLSAPEQKVFRRLGVFVGGFALELAQAVAADEDLDGWAVLDALGALVDKSLVISDAADPPRYRLLETTRACALEKLAAATETDAWLERHARALCNFFERSEAARRGEQGRLSNVDFVRRTAPELDNLRFATDWAAGERGDLDLAIGLAGSSALTFANLSLAVEAADRLMSLRARLDAAEGGSVSPSRAALFWLGLAVLGQSFRVPLAVALDAARRAEGFYCAQGLRKRLHNTLAIKAILLTMVGDGPSALQVLGEMCEIEAPGWAARSIGMRMRAQGWVHVAQGQLEEALNVYRDMRTLMQHAAGERRSLMESESELCRCLYLMGRHDACIELAHAVRARERGTTPGAMAVLLRYLMLAQAASGRLDDARQTLLGAMPHWRRHGVFLASGALAVVLAELGCRDDAARVGAAANAFLRRTQIRWHPSMQHTNERWQTVLETGARDPNDLERWQREGEALDEAAIEAICLRTEGPFRQVVLHRRPGDTAAGAA